MCQSNIGGILTDSLYIEVFHPFPCPRCLAQKGQARLDRWVKIETADRDTGTEFVPAILLYQTGQDIL